MANALATTYVIINTGGFKLIGVKLSTYATGDTVDLDAAGASVATIYGAVFGPFLGVATTPIMTSASNRITMSSAASNGSFLVWGA